MLRFYRYSKLTILIVCKYIGIFWLSKRLTTKGLRIICYHNFSDGEMLDWSPDMFISSRSLAKRLNHLKIKGYSILSLSDALKGLKENDLPPNPVVITIDDGWYNTYRLAHDQFASQDIPYTVYVTGYYSRLGLPLFNHVLHYMFWRTKKDQLPLSSMDFKFPKHFGESIQLHDKQKVDTFITHCHCNLGAEERTNLAKNIATFLQVDYDNLVNSRDLNLMTPDELRELSKDQVDIQLHTYRHHWPIDMCSAKTEIIDDRAYLEPIIGKNLNHLCYPSGVWRTGHLSLLSKLNIKSATTCDSGMNYPGCNSLTLKRFLDSENVAQIEFEAELSGFLSLLRLLKNWFIT